MMTIRITVPPQSFWGKVQVLRTPRWETIQQMMREMTGDGDGLLTKIARLDHGCDYRGKGTYVCSFRTAFSVLPFTLILEDNDDSDD